MSTCDITSGFTLGCRDNTGGISNLYILSGSITTVTDVSEGLINGISGSGEFYKFELFRQTSDFTEAITSTPENGTVFYEQTLNAVFFKLQSSTRNQIKVLAQNPNLKVIVETNNGTVDGVGRYWFLGEDRGMQLLSGTGASGTAFGDLNGYTLAFTGQEPNPASEISGSLAGVLDGITLG
jgi:hypothetical protein|tara:strand:- start:454 stop:996 length:543 start_codon:yes stop_codon:yes gene_type:complete